MRAPADTPAATSASRFPATMKMVRLRHRRWAESGAPVRAGKCRFQRQAGAEPWRASRISCPPDVRRALADLAAARQPAVTDDLGDDLPEHQASPSQQNRRARPSGRAPVPQAARLRQCDRDEARPRARSGAVPLVQGRADRGRGSRRDGGRAPVGGEAARLDRRRFPLWALRWTEAGDRVYGIMYGENCFAVHTTMRRGAPK
jgi:hypothetical protein